MDVTAIKHFRQGGLMALGLLLLTAIGLAYFVGSGNFKIAFAIVVVCSGFMLGVLMGEKYFYLLPLGFTLKLPAVNLIGGRALEIPEAAALGIGVLAVLRVCLKQEYIRIFRPAALGVILYTGWVFFILWQNPVGLAILGGSSGGGRFYIKILLAAVVFLVLSNQKITEKDAKWIFWIIIISVWISASYSILGYFRGRMESFGDEESFYSWHQILAQPALWTIMALFGYFKPSEILTLKNAKIVLLCVFLGLVTLYSGKRAGLGAIALIPLMAAALHREWKYVILSGFGMVVIGMIMVIGHGTWFEAPKTFQRALSWLPGDWDKEVLVDTTGNFRVYLREMAAEEIQKDWLYGRKGIIVVFRDVLGIKGGIAYDQSRLVAEGHAMSSNWHNTWLGIAADFGIPGALFFGLSLLQWLWFSNKSVQLVPPEMLYVRAIALICFYSAVIFALRSWTSGHSALVPFQYWWLFGLSVALYFSLRVRSKRDSRKTLPETPPTSMVPMAVRQGRHASK